MLVSVLVSQISGAWHGYSVQWPTCLICVTLGSTLLYLRYILPMYLPYLQVGI